MSKFNNNEFKFTINGFIPEKEYFTLVLNISFIRIIYIGLSIK